MKKRSRTNKILLLFLINPQFYLAFDEDDGCIEIQYYDGTVEEQDMEYWESQSLKPTEQPEDWSGSLDIERDDYGVDLESNAHLDLKNPLDEIEQ